MKLNEIVTAEKVIKDELGLYPTKDIFPITLIKFLLNRKKLMNFFERTDQYEILDLQSYIDFNYATCDACINNERGMLCRKHTSIERIIETDHACFDVDTGIYIYMNEIFKFSEDGKKLAVVYAPHTKLIQGQLTEHKVKKISMFNTYIPSNQHFNIIRQTNFSSNELMDMYIKVWFNDELSLVSIPCEELGFCLVPNK